MTQPAPGNARARPNVLVIVSDQHRLDCIGRSNDYPVSTPHLDALAAEGTWYESAYTPIPLCTPARQSFLTGRRAESTGGLWNYDLGSRIPALDPGNYSWPRELQRAGYSSRYIGKWHVSPDHDPTAFGYDSWIPLEDYDRWRAKRHPGAVIPAGWFGGIDSVPAEDSRTHWMANRAIEYLRDVAATGASWHLRLDFLEPHLPCVPTAEFAELYPPESIPPWRDFVDDLEGKPYIQRQQLFNWGVEAWTWEKWAPIVARYYAIIAQLDDAIGKVLRALEELGAASDTVVVYTTDHGDLCGSHGMMDKHYVMYDEVVRVPLILRWPGRIAPSSEPSFVYNMLDLAPTIAAVADVPGPPMAHGTALIEARGDAWEATATIADRTHVVTTYNGQQFGLFTQRMLRTKTWKYVWNPTDVDELYDLVDDPEELINRIDDESVAETLQDLRNALYEQLRADGDSMVANDWMARQLTGGRKLGARSAGNREGELV